MFRVILLHSGKWVKDTGACNQWNYDTDADAVGLMISRDCTYDDLLNKVHRSLNLNQAETTLTLKFGVRTVNGSPPIQIKNDDDINFFIAEVENPEYRNPLCVDAKQRIG